MDDQQNGDIYQAATNPVLAVRLSGAPRFPRPGYPEVLDWVKVPALDLWSLQEAIYQAIKNLSERSRAVILARFAEETTLIVYGERIGRSRERVRQLEIKALRQLRRLLGEDTLIALGAATEIMPLPGSALDPDWVDTRQAEVLTGYTRQHIRWLCRQKYVVCQINPLKRDRYQISRKSLEAYIKSRPGDGRKTGKWYGSTEVNHE